MSAEHQRADQRKVIETNSLPIRKHPAHGVLIKDDEPTIVFDTICTKDRVPWLANSDVHDVLREVWQAATFWRVGRYVIMPDHIHLFAGLGQAEFEYEKWVQYWKSQFTKQYRAKFGKLPAGSWQTDDWHTRLWRWQIYDEKWNYVVNNPVRHQLVERSSDWPYQGEIFRLGWD